MKWIVIGVEMLEDCLPGPLHEFRQVLLDEASGFDRLTDGNCHMARSDVQGVPG